jgi:hypothetical protein
MFLPNGVAILSMKKSVQTLLCFGAKNIGEIDFL